jgi:hypothetical protein
VGFKQEGNMYTYSEQQKKIGTVEVRNFQGLQVAVKIVDIKVAYGVLRYQVEVDGQKSNRVWINA